MGDNSTFIKVGAVAAAVYVAYTQGWLSFLGLGTPAASASSGTPAPVSANSPAAGVPASAPTSTPAVTLDSVYTSMTAKAKAAGEPASLGVDAWGYYVNQSGVTAPDPMPIFSAAVPNFDRSQTFTAAQYWAIMAPALKSQLGLSGLGVYGDLGQMMWRYAR